MDRVNKLRPSNKELHGIKPDPTTPRPPKPSSQNTVNKYDEVISVALWAIRRLSSKQHKEFAYDELDEVTGQKWERV